MIGKIAIASVALGVFILISCIFLGIGSASRPIRVRIVNKSSSEISLWTATFQDGRWRTNGGTGLPAPPNASVEQAMFTETGTNDGRYRIGLSGSEDPIRGTAWAFSSLDVKSNISYEVRRDHGVWKAMATRGHLVDGP